ncbi:MAG: hypothetical protein LBU76_04620 [Azoarcus sp.]|jgi:hypothetical protein|nr:hypothetical protein [Azoarcus sp.]
MSRKLLYSVPLCLFTQLCFAEYYPPGVLPEIVNDPEPNWETAKYTCPLSIKTTKGEHEFEQYFLYDVMGKTWVQLTGERRKFVPYRFLENFKGVTFHHHLVCKYKGTDTEVAIYVKDAIACGSGGNPLRTVCWATDPYAGKKK